MRTRIPAKAPRHHTCRTALPVFPVFFMTILLLLCSVPAYAEIRMIDQGALLRAYGFSNGRYDSVEAMIYEFDPSIEVPVGHIEGAACIDSALEFFTAARYGSVRVTPSSRRVVDRELPRGREGDLKLGAAWLMKLSKAYTSQVCVHRALAFISGRSGVGVSEIRDYFRREVTRRLVAIARVEFPAGTSLPETIQPLIDYVASFDGRGNLRVNDEALFNELLRSVQNVYNRTNSAAYIAYMNTIDSISASLSTRITSNLQNGQISMMLPSNNNGRVVAQDIRGGR